MHSPAENKIHLIILPKSKLFIRSSNIEIVISEHWMHSES